MATDDRTPPDKPLSVYTKEQFIAAYKKQRDDYGWDFSQEREFMEDLFCTRFNFLLVCYSLFVTAAAAAWQNRPLFVAIAFAGCIVCFSVWLTIMRAFVKMNVLLQILYRVFHELPISMVNNEARAIGSFSLFPVNPLIAYWIPLFITASLFVGGVARSFGWADLPAPPVAP